MNIIHLEAFIATAALGSFSAAARQLNISQPTVSARVAALEKEVGSKLLLRTRQPLRLTQRAIEILPFAEQIVEASGQISDTRSTVRRGVQHVFRIGTHSSCASAIIPRISAELKKEFSNVQIDFEIGPSPALLDKMNRGALDFCIMSLGSTESDIYVVPLVDLTPRWFAQKGVVDGRKVTEKQLNTYTLVTFRKWSDVYKSVEKHLRGRRAWPVDMIVTDNREAILGALEMPATIGTLYVYPSWIDPALAALEEIETGIDLPASNLSLCCKSIPSFVSRRKLTQIVLQATSGLGGLTQGVPTGNAP
ncbi:LysR family transcriptional regulator [Mameliella sediminis]|uniref:LysR family transcriptional regulator n=1 Tax=Mameliella sediminis TaxID=2836866 RepID=UPI001C444C2B|nr:LysR family transcriptional regulator [Mameliella sediminis]MBV7396906.1 LysR family transcriptional regulator [Mameliella sediminis]